MKAKKPSAKFYQTLAGAGALTNSITSPAPNLDLEFLMKNDLSLSKASKISSNYKMKPVGAILKDDSPSKYDSIDIEGTLSPRHAERKTGIGHNTMRPV